MSWRAGPPGRSWPGGELLGLVVAVVLSAACTPVGDPGPSPEPVPGEDPDPDEEVAEAPLPSLEEGEPEPGDVETMEERLREAEGALEAGDAGAARRIALEVMEEHPRAPGSTGALWVLARASLEQGDHREADDAVTDFLAVLDEGDAGLRGDALLLQGRARLADGRLTDGVRALLAIPPEASEPVLGEAMDRLRSSVQGLSDEEVDQVLAEGAPGPRGEVLRVERAVRHHLDGDEQAARALAGEALEGDPAETERRLARAIAEGRAEEEVTAVAGFGALLPTEGPPSIVRSAEEISYGLDVAVEALEGQTRQGLQVLAPQGSDASGFGQDRVRELEDEGALALIGPLTEGELREAAEARRTNVPILSPTARTVPDDLRGEGVYSLRSVDPGGARKLAVHATDEGYGSAVILRPDQGPAEEEARHFAEAFQEAGGTIRDEVVYPSGQADLAEEMARIRGVGPSVLFLPVPPEEVENVATQMAFHEVTDAEPLLLGTEGWASPEILRSVPAHHTDGVRVAVPAPAGEDPPGYREFVDAYEGHYRRTFRSPDAVLGWDAVGLLARVLEGGARTGDEVRRQLERLEGFQGATGILSVRDGRVVRDQELARIEDGALQPIR